MTFKKMAEEWIKLYLPSLKNIKHQKTLARTFTTYIYPFIENQPLSQIKRKDLVEIVKSAAKKGLGDTTNRIAGRMKQVFDYAIDVGEIEHNPAVGLSRVVQSVKSKPQNAIKLEELPELLKAIETYDEPISKLGLLLLAHTFVRTKELIHARWDEFDFKNQLWVIPAERMKLKKPHVVPISDQVEEILKELADYSLASGWVLESPVKRGHPISENTLLFALYRLGYRGRMTGHGFRAVASTALNQSGLWQVDAIERQLAHKETDLVRAAYNHADYLGERKKMMQ